VKIKSHLIEFDPQGSYATLRVSLEDFDEDALEELTQIQNHVGDRPPLLVIDIKMMARANRATNATETNKKTTNPNPAKNVNTLNTRDL